VGGGYSKKRLIMKSVRRLALATDAVAFATIVLGSWTRINGAGLTCPDWPLCQGRLLPLLTNGTAFEWLHRLFALALAPLVVALLVAAWRKRDRSPFVAPSMSFIAVLFGVQVLLGAETVHLANTPLSVVVHWGTAMAFVAAVSALAIFAAACDEVAATPSDASRAPIVTTGILAAATAVAFVTMCLGAYVSSSGAGLACLSVPDCAGNVVVYSPSQYVQMLHRVAAAATLVLAAASLAVAWACSATARVRACTAAGVALVCVQVLLGLLNVALRLPSDLREAHAINAALVFLTFVVATTFAVLDAGVLRRGRDATVRS
jgi:heme A synthase